MIKTIQQIEELYADKKSRIEGKYHQVIADAEHERSWDLDLAQRVYHWQRQRLAEGKVVLTKGMAWRAKSEQHAKDFLDYVNTKRNWRERDFTIFMDGSIYGNCVETFSIEFADGTVTMVSVEEFETYFEVIEG